MMTKDGMRVERVQFRWLIRPVAPDAVEVQIPLGPDGLRVKLDTGSMVLTELEHDRAVDAAQTAVIKELMIIR
jgi:hypothetical protein